MARSPYVAKVPVISIGNLSVGGTGKSVFVAFIIRKFFTSLQGAIVMRGYKGGNERSGKSFLVSDGVTIFSSSTFSGDEAHMLALQTKTPVLVGASRTSSLKLAERALCDWRKKALDFIVLDDGYQNTSIKKTVDIVLLDARYPFENGHCLPAGRLRENDLSRADIVVLTHAEKQSVQSLQKSRVMIERAGFQGPIFEGRHAPVGFFDVQGDLHSYSFLKGKRVGIFAGLGNFSGFYTSIIESGAHVVVEVEYEDHHSYSDNDLTYLAQAALRADCKILVTTFKDWVKISAMNKESFSLTAVEIVYLEINFAFLHEQDDKKFHDSLKKLIG